MEYTREEYLNMLESYVNSGSIANIYKKNNNDKTPLNYLGRITDGNREYYSEVAAEWLMENKEKFDHISKTQREDKYILSTNGTHDGKQDDKYRVIYQNDSEKILAKIMFNVSKIVEENNNVGKIIDYQVPLKNKQTDENGEIDLVSFNKNVNKLYLIELKKPGNYEGILKALMEIYVYSKQINFEKLEKELNNANIKTDDTKLEFIPAILVHKESSQYERYHNYESKKLRNLIDKFGIEIFFYEIEDEGDISRFKIEKAIETKYENEKLLSGSEEDIFLTDKNKVDSP